MDEQTENLKDFEIRIIEHWRHLKDSTSSDERVDLIDATVDFLEQFPAIEIEELSFSDGFKDRIRRDAEKRNMMNKKKEKKKIESTTLNLLEI